MIPLGRDNKIFAIDKEPFINEDFVETPNFKVLQKGIQLEIVALNKFFFLNNEFGLLSLCPSVFCSFQVTQDSIADIPI